MISRFFLIFTQIVGFYQIFFIRFVKSTFIQQRTEISPMWIIRLKVSAQEQLSGLLQSLSRPSLERREKKRSENRRKRHGHVTCSLLPAPLRILTNMHTRERVVSVLSRRVTDKAAMMDRRRVSIADSALFFSLSFSRRTRFQHALFYAVNLRDSTPKINRRRQGRAWRARGER